MRRVGYILVHSHRAQRVVHPPPDFLRRHAQILRRERHVLFHHIGDNLIVRVLEHHPHPLAHGQQQFLIPGVHSLHIDRPAGGQQHRVERLGQCGFTGTVMAQNHHKTAPRNLQIYAVQRDGLFPPLFRRIRETQILCLQNHRHESNSPLLAFS